MPKNHIELIYTKREELKISETEIAAIRKRSSGGRGRTTFFEITGHSWNIQMRPFRFLQLVFLPFIVVLITKWWTEMRSFLWKHLNRPQRMCSIVKTKIKMKTSYDDRFIGFLLALVMTAKWNFSTFYSNQHMRMQSLICYTYACETNALANG